MVMMVVLLKIITWELWEGTGESRDINQQRIQSPNHLSDTKAITRWKVC